MSDKREVKQCPFCSEEILATAKKCKHCHSFIEEEPVKEAQATEVREVRQTPKAPPPIPPKAPPPPSRGSFQQQKTGAADSISPAPQAPAPTPPPRPSVPKMPPRQAAGIGATPSASPVSQSTSVLESSSPPAAAYQTNVSESTPVGKSAGSAYDYPKAPIGKRIAAYIIDSLIAGTFFLIYLIASDFMYYDIFFDIDYFIEPFYYPLTYVFLTWLIFYMLLRDGFGAGQSWGKETQGLMVVNLTDNKPCSKGKSAARNSVTLVLGLIPIINSFTGMIDPLIAIANQKGHRIGDMLAKTQVIEVGKYEVKGE
jgi:uncharacterized RDD family membrane protein YckC